MRLTMRLGAVAAALALLAGAAPVQAEMNSAASYNQPVLNMTMVDDGASAKALLHDIVDMAGGYIAPQPEWNNGVTSRFPSMVLGIVTQEFSGTISLGRKPDGSIPTERDIYPLSSISKMLTGLMVAQGVVNNDFTQDAPVRKLLKPDVGRFVGKLTIGQVVSHFAGLRDMPANVRPRKFPYSPGKNYSRDDLIACLRNTACSHAPVAAGSTYTYSNLGVGLLGVALTDFYGKSYEQILSEKLTQPLGMTDTHTRAFVTDESRIVNGTAPDGASVPPATMGVLAGSGEVLTTGHDMVLLLKMLLNPPEQLKTAVTLAITPIFAGARVGYAIDVMESSAGYGITLTTPNGRPIAMRSKAGSQPGFSSLIVWSPDLQSGTFALTNAGLSPRTLAPLLVGIMRKINAHPGASQGRSS